MTTGEDMSTIVQSIRGEFLRYKSLGEGAVAQLRDEELCASPPGGGNSVATICWHIAGNFRSRFTDFLTTDGEKPWRQREEEFDDRQVTRAELLAKWESGWSTVLSTLAGLSDASLAATVTIRAQPLLVHEALHRSLAHVAYHVGQIVHVARAMRGDAWKSLSIPRGMSAAYNQAPSHERPPKG
jgi:uncharacterized damage-inducible protein DinB